MLVDANLLLYATDSSTPDHQAASNWLTTALNGDQRVGIPWQTIGSFLRSLPIPGNLVPDAQLAAMAIENGVALYSADSDFARFPGLTWINPLRPG